MQNQSVHVLPDLFRHTLCWKISLPYLGAEGLAQCKMKMQEPLFQKQGDMSFKVFKYRPFSFLHGLALLLCFLFDM